MLLNTPRRWARVRTVLTVALLLVGGTLLGSARSDAANGVDATSQCLQLHGQRLGLVGDANGDGQVTVDELLMAVNNAASGCQLMPIDLQFRAMVGTATFGCGNVYHNVGTSQADITPSDFRFYIHDIRLVNGDGAEVPLTLVQDHLWQLDNLALLDFENKVRPCNEGTTQTNSTVHGFAPPDEYTGVRFRLGVPFDMDHIDEATAPSPLNLSGMFWSWQDGYKFLRIDTAFDNVRVHVGSTGCVSGPGSVVTSCARPNIGEIELDNFNPSRNVIAADLAALLSDNDINANQPDTAPGCQSDPGDLDCVPMFKNLGVNFSDGSPNPTSQKFFRVQ